MKFSYILLIISVLSCKPKQVILGATNRVKPSNVSLSENQIIKKNLNEKNDFEWFNGVASIEFKDNYQAINLNATIRMKKDSIVWVALKKFGIEGARLLITIDSVFLLDRLKKEVRIGSSRAFAKKIGLNEEDETNLLHQIQEIIMGNIVLLPVQKYDLSRVENQYKLEGNFNEVISQYLFDDSYKLKSIRFLDHKKNTDFEELLDNYKKISLDSLILFPFKRVIFAGTSDGNLTKLKINFKSIEIEKRVLIPFSIPTNYERKKWQ